MQECLPSVSVLYAKSMYCQILLHHRIHHQISVAEKWTQLPKDIRFNEKEEIFVIRFCLRLFCLILLLAGCGEKAEEQTIETQVDKYTVSIDRLVEIPEDFPGDVYIYPRSNAIDVTQTQETYSLTLSTSHEVPRIAETYRRQMTIRGWSPEAVTTSGTESLLAFTKEDRVANVVIGPAKEKVHIRVTVTTE